MWQPGLGSQGVSRAQSTWVFLVGKTAGQRVRSRYAASPGMGSVRGKVPQGHLVGGGAGSEEECQAGWREARSGCVLTRPETGTRLFKSGLPPPRVSLRPREGENVGLGRGVTHPRQGPEPFLRSCPRGTTPSLPYPVPTLSIAGLLRGGRDPPGPSHRKPLVSSG